MVAGLISVDRTSIILESMGIAPKCLGEQIRLWVECWDAAFEWEIRALLPSDRRYKAADGVGL